MTLDWVLCEISAKIDSRFLGEYIRFSRSVRGKELKELEIKSSVPPAAASVGVEKVLYPGSEKLTEGGFCLVSDRAEILKLWLRLLR